MMTMYSILTGESMIEIEKTFEGKGYGDFKMALAEKVSGFLTPLQEKIRTLLEDEDHLRHTIELGAQKARAIATKKMIEVRKKIGVA